MEGKKQTADEILHFMDGLLIELIENAKKLNERSLQVIAEEELTTLQETQETLFNSLLEADENLHAQHPELKHFPASKLQVEVNKKLDQFQELNQTFIENLKSSHGIIQFESEPPKKPKPPHKQ
jgi:hypothetical protein